MVVEVDIVEELACVDSATLEFVWFTNKVGFWSLRA
jgi:hypothetical protein